MFTVRIGATKNLKNLFVNDGKDWIVAEVEIDECLCGDPVGLAVFKLLKEKIFKREWFIYSYEVKEDNKIIRSEDILNGTMETKDIKTVDDVDDSVDGFAIGEFVVAANRYRVKVIENKMAEEKKADKPKTELDD